MEIVAIVSDKVATGLHPPKMKSRFAIWLAAQMGQKMAAMNVLQSAVQVVC
jgi:hypothetical protein